MNSKFLALNGKDFLKGLLVAVLSAVLITFNQVFEKEGLNLNLSDLKIILTTGIGAGIAYLIKNFVQNSAGQIGISERNKLDSNGNK